MPETQKPQDYSSRDTGQVLRSKLRVDPGMPNQVHPTTPKVYLTKEKYLESSGAMAEVKNIATLMDMMMDEDFLERCRNNGISFYISSKDIPQELIDALARLSADGQFIYFRINREKRTLNPLPESQYDRLSFDERGIMYRDILEGIREGGLLRIIFTGSGWWVNYPAYFGTEVHLSVAFTEPTD